jgi:hypothetical protein
MATYEFWTNDWRIAPKVKKGYLAYITRDIDDKWIYPTKDDTIFINGTEREVLGISDGVVCGNDYIRAPQRITIWVKR